MIKHCIKKVTAVQGRFKEDQYVAVKAGTSAILRHLRAKHWSRPKQHIILMWRRTEVIKCTKSFKTEDTNILCPSPRKYFIPWKQVTKLKYALCLHNESCRALNLHWAAKITRAWYRRRSHDSCHCFRENLNTLPWVTYAAPFLQYIYQISNWLICIGSNLPVN